MKITNFYRRINDLYSYLPKRFGKGWAFPPLRIGLVLTHACNLRCGMCFVWRQSRPKEKQHLTTEEVLGVIAQSPPWSIITLTGGEPMLRKDIFNIIDRACAKRRVHLVTNAYLIDASKANSLISFAPSGIGDSFRKGLVSIGVSLEGLRDLHNRFVGVSDAFERTSEAIRLLSKARSAMGKRLPFLDLKVVITKDNYESLVDIFELAESLDMDICSFQIQNNQESSYGLYTVDPKIHLKEPKHVEAIDRNALLKVIDELYARAKESRSELRFNPAAPKEIIAEHYQNNLDIRRFSCSAAWTVMHINPYGDVFPCFSFNMGNIREHSLKAIWNGEPYRNFRSALAAAKIFPGCIGCCVMRFEG